MVNEANRSNFRFGVQSGHPLMFRHWAKLDIRVRYLQREAIWTSATHRNVGPPQVRDPHGPGKPQHVALGAFELTLMIQPRVPKRIIELIVEERLVSKFNAVP